MKNNCHSRILLVFMLLTVAGCALSPLRSPSYTRYSANRDDFWVWQPLEYRSQSGTNFFQGRADLPISRVHGVLYHNRVEVTATNIGEKVETNIGAFEWRGSKGGKPEEPGTGWHQVGGFYSGPPIR